MEILNNDIQRYCDLHTSRQSPLLETIERETHLYTTQPNMLSGHYQGRFLSFISKLLRPKYILEIGTFTGFASLCLAEGLGEDAELHSLEINPELEKRVKGYWAKSPFKEQMYFHLENAHDFLNKSDKKWDLVFIDAEKKGYQDYFISLQENTKEGSVLIADNVLWKGKVVDEDRQDSKTKSLRDFNKLVDDHPHWENILLPIRDGLMMARKRC